MLYLILYVIGLFLHAGFIFEVKKKPVWKEFTACILTGVFWPFLWIMGLGYLLANLGD